MTEIQPEMYEKVKKIILFVFYLKLFIIMQIIIFVSYFENRHIWIDDFFKEIKKKYYKIYLDFGIANDVMLATSEAQIGYSFFYWAILNTINKWDTK